MQRDEAIVKCLPPSRKRDGEKQRKGRRIHMKVSKNEGRKLVGFAATVGRYKRHTTKVAARETRRSQAKTKRRHKEDEWHVVVERQPCMITSTKTSTTKNRDEEDGV